VKKRLFIGVDICEEARHAAAVYIDDLAKQFNETAAKWERPEKLHITLKFLGGVDDERVAGLLTALQSVGAAIDPFHFEVAGTGAFPSAQNPRVLWLGINDQKEKLLELAASVDDACTQLGFEAETRRFSPHLTIARIREPHRATDLGQTHVENKFGPVQCVCGELVLFESHLGRGGSVYTKFAAAKLRGG